MNFLEMLLRLNVELVRLSSVRLVSGIRTSKANLRNSLDDG